MLKNERIFITGGAGYLGQQLIENLYPDNDITVYSRDENKHYFLKKKFPKVRCIIGDIRNFDLLNKSMQGHTIGIFAASLKQIETVDQNIDESIEVIIRGARNSRQAAINNKLKAATFISTDKSKNPTTLYGAMKFVAAESFIVNAEQEQVKLSAVVFGNLLDSTGSIIPLIWDAIKNDYEIKLYGDDMTRFMTDKRTAVASVLEALNHTGASIVPVIPAFKVKDLFEIYTEKFGLRWTLGEPRLSEKIHEDLFAPHEVPRTSKVKRNDIEFFVIHYKELSNSLNPSEINFSSESCVSKQAFHELLKKYDYYKPKTVHISFPSL